MRDSNHPHDPVNNHPEKVRNHYVSQIANNAKVRKPCSSAKLTFYLFSSQLLTMLTKTFSFLLLGLSNLSVVVCQGPILFSVRRRCGCSVHFRALNLIQFRCNNSKTNNLTLLLAPTASKLLDQRYERAGCVCTSGWRDEHILCLF